MFRLTMSVCLLTLLSLVAFPAKAVPWFLRVYYADQTYNEIVGESGNPNCPKWGRTTIYYIIEDCV